MPHRYRDADPRVNRRTLAAALAALVLWLGPAHAALAAPVTIVALGDSLTAGYGLAGVAAAFPAQLEAGLRARGVDAQVVNAGVSGDTSAGGRARLDWSVADGTGLVILELGANDALRGLDPQATYANLDAILASLAERHIPVLLAGMLAPPNLGAAYAGEFRDLYTRLAAARGVPLYPFFLDGVAAEPTLLQADGMHPNLRGVAVIVGRIVPYVVDALGLGGA